MNYFENCVKFSGTFMIVFGIGQGEFPTIGPSPVGNLLAEQPQG